MIAHVTLTSHSVLRQRPAHLCRAPNSQRGTVAVAHVRRPPPTLGAASLRLQAEPESGISGRVGQGGLIL